MSNDTAGGGPAFPIAMKDEGHPTPLAPGMTLRDYFAGQVILGLIARAGINPAICPENDAEDAYVIADALLKARHP